MTVVVLSNCPPKLRGDMTKWLMEINTGVYVGNISARVREELWQRICENLKNGQATMVFRAAGEQHMDFRVHNTTWKPVDYEGIKLMRRPSAKTLRERDKPALPDGFSNAALYRKVRAVQRKRSEKVWQEYTVIDVETTGLRPEQGHIIEIGALRVHEGTFREELSVLVSSDIPLPSEIVQLTGITDEMLQKQGIPLRAALERLKSFIGDGLVVCHNLPFDMLFLNTAYQSCGMEVIKNPSRDTLVMARKRIRSIADYKLTTLAQHFGLNTETAHRALADCRLTALLYQKLNEL